MSLRSYRLPLLVRHTLAIACITCIGGVYGHPIIATFLAVKKALLAAPSVELAVIQHFTLKTEGVLKKRTNF